LYTIEKPHKLQIADVFTVKVRRERPARKADKGSLYRSKEEFIKYILSQPVRRRIVGELGRTKERILQNLEKWYLVKINTAYP
jgi:hypothetical protein